jgi:hypothetical protein
MARVQVFVETSDGRPVEDVDVVLRGVETRELAPGRTPGNFEGEAIPPGRYDLEAVPRSADLGRERRPTELTAGSNTVTIVLGRSGEPFFQLREEKVYFEPDNSTFLLVARGEAAPVIVRRVLVEQGLEGDPLPPVLASHGEPRTPSDSAYWLVRLPAGEHVEAAEGRISALTAALERQGLEVRPALVVRRGERPVLGLTTELVVRFIDSVPTEEADAVAAAFGLRNRRRVRHASNAFAFTRSGAPTYELLSIAQLLHDDPRVVYAEPQLVQQLELDQFIPNDPLWLNLTHLPLINSDDAWQTLGAIDTAIRGGSPAITIAVFDPEGVAPNHPDLTADLTDGTSKLVRSFDFLRMKDQTVANLVGDHGTQCAGSATAAFGNSRGTAGVAPNCHLIGARLPSPATGVEMADAFLWAAGFDNGNSAANFPALPSRKADVIANSWGERNAPLSPVLQDCFDYLTTFGRGGRGCTVVFSVGNLGNVPFSTVRRFAAYERNLAVGASINVNPTTPVDSADAAPNGAATGIATSVDTRALYSPFGLEMDIVAPSHTAFAPPNDRLIDPITSTVRVGTGNLNGCLGPTVCTDYAATFGGTSHAAPTVAGAAALVLSVAPRLSWLEVRRILRTSAVRIDAAQTDLTGRWVDDDGDGVAEFSQWYGFGRLDVDAAVRAARDLTAFADIVVRENLTDTGAVPSGGLHAQSPDIWVRRTDDPIPALAYDAEPPHQSPRRGQDNVVFCRVKNVGTAPSAQIYVRALVTHFPGLDFRYPQDFIPAARPGEPLPDPLQPATYLIGEVRVDTLPSGADRIVKMRWQQALVPPATVVVDGVTATWNPCLLLEASPHDGPLPAGSTSDVQRDNNIAQRSINILDPGDPISDAFTVVVAGSSNGRGVASLVIDRSELPSEARVLVRLADAARMAELTGELARVNVTRAAGREVRLLNQTRLSIAVGNGTMVIESPPGTRLDWLSNSRVNSEAVARSNHHGVEAIEVGAGESVVELPLQLNPDQYTPLLVAVLRNGAQGVGELRLMQRLGTGELSAGFTVALPA